MMYLPVNEVMDPEDLITSCESTFITQRVQVVIFLCYRAGRDAARAFTTGCFKEHLTHDIRGLSDKELKVCLNPLLSSPR
jgi:hypothetical protein